jgi:DGQHR domain-containing protein
MATKRLIVRKVSQPIGDFYITSLPACELINLCKSNVRKYVDEEGKREGIQRKQKKNRIIEIDSFIRSFDASFPSSIILNIDTEKINYYKKIGNEDLHDYFEIEIEATEDAFSVIDGQHRLAGFANDNCANFDLVVSIFVGLEIELQAYLFTSINVNQKPVDKSLAYDLFDLAQTPSPQKTCHTIVNLLNSDETSPLFKRIRLLGSAPEFDGEVLYKAMFSQGTIIQRLIKLVSSDPNGDRDTQKHGEDTVVEAGWLDRGLIFRKFYAEKNDWVIFKILMNYFNAVRTNFPDEWEDRSNPLCKTIGLGALLTILVNIYRDGVKGGDVSEEYFSNRFRDIRTNYDDIVERHLGFKFTMRNYGPAGSGERAITKFLHAMAGYADKEEFIREREEVLQEQEIRD